MRKLEWRVVKGVAPHHLGRGLWPRTRAQFPLLPSYFGSLRLQLFEWFHYFWGFLLGLELSSIQFSCSVMSNSSQPHGLQHTRLPCPSPTPGACSNSVSIESVMPSNRLILCRPLLLLPSVFLNIKVFSSESVLRIRWPKYWSFSFNISPFNEYSVLISFRIEWFDPRVFSNTTVQRHQFFSAQLSIWSNSHIHAWLLGNPQPWLDGLCWQSNISAF